MTPGGQRFASYHAASPSSEALSWGGGIAGPINLSTAKGRFAVLDVAGGKALKLRLEGSSLTITETATGRTGTFDLAKLAGSGGQLSPIVTPNAQTGARTPLRLAPASGDLVAEVVIVNVTAQFEDEHPYVTHVNFWVALAP
jgi:hypothetical protein